MQHGVAAELLACTPMLGGLGSELLSAIILRGDTVRFSAGQTVTQAGTPADAALYILEGRIALLDQNVDDITPSLEPGAGLSEMAMFVETEHYHNTVAIEDVVALHISRELMGHLVFERPGLTECFAANIMNNLANTAKQISELDTMLEETHLPEPDPEQDACAEDEIFSLPPAPAVVTESARAPDDFRFPELPQEGFGENRPEVTQFEILNIEDNKSAPVRDIMAELSQFSLRLDLIPPEPAHDQTAFPSLAPPQ